VSFHSQPLSPHDETIEAMAAAWLAQRDDGLTVEEQVDFDRWQKADPRHAAAVARLEQTWTALQQLREFRPESKIHPNRDLLAGARSSARIMPFPAAAALVGLAAALVIGAVVWWPNRVVRPVEQSIPEFATTADGYQRVTLKDGSILELNANSLARVEFTPGERHVELVRGEGHFTVAKDAKHPFIVHANSVSVRAVGTAFNVRLNESDVEVLVTEGHVKVENHLATKSATLPAELPELGAGQRLVVSTKLTPDNGPIRAETVAPESMQESLAWQGPRLRFVDTPLASVVAQFNRHNQIQIELADDSLMNVPVDGSFRSENVEAFIRLLETDRSIVAERVGQDRIVLRRAP